MNNSQYVFLFPSKYYGVKEIIINDKTGTFQKRLQTLLLLVALLDLIQAPWCLA